MNKVRRTLASATTIGLTLVAAGCSSNVIGADGPRPGVAAEVEGTTITLDDLERVTDGLCVLQAADPAAAPTSRAYAQTQILQAWVSSLVAIAYAEREDVEVTPPPTGLEQSLGWKDVDEDDVDALRDYVDAFVLSETIQREIPEPPDPADYDLTINPRFDLRFEADSFEAGGTQLSVPVSKEAQAEAAAPTDEELRALPDDELCGKRPAATPEIPLG